MFVSLPPISLIQSLHDKFKVLNIIFTADTKAVLNDNHLLDSLYMINIPKAHITVNDFKIEKGLN